MSKFVKEHKQITELQIISFVVVLCHFKIFLNFPFFTVQGQTRINPGVDILSGKEAK